MRATSRNGRLLISGFALLLTSVACGRGPAREFRIALVAPTTGFRAAPSGIPSIEGAEMAVDELNAAGGVRINGKSYRIVLIKKAYEDHGQDAAGAVREAVNLDSVHAIVGPQISAHALSAAPVAEAAGVPLISPMSSNPALTKDRRFVSRLAFLDEYQGRALARFARSSLRLKSAATLYDAADPYGRVIAELFQRTFEALGGKIVGAETFVTDGGNEFSPQLRRLLARRPEALLLPNYAAQDSFQVRQARALGFRGTFLGSDNWDPVSMAHMVEAQGTVIVSQWSKDLPRAATAAFTKNFETRYHHTPRSTAAVTYDAIRILADAAARAGSLDGEALATAIRAPRVVVGAGATYRFTGTGDPSRGGALHYLLNGKDSLIVAVEDTPE